MIWQHLALCRFIYIWAVLYLLNIISYSPILLLGIIILIECLSQLVLNKSKLFKKKHSNNFKKKHKTILTVDIIIFLLLLIKSKNIYFKENVTFLILYMIILLFHKTNILELHNKFLLVYK